MHVARTLNSSRKPLVTATGLLALATAVPFGLPYPTPDGVQAQSQAQSTSEAEEGSNYNGTSYEVASIRPRSTDSGMISWAFNPDGFTAKNVTLQMLIEWAYGVEEYQISGSVKWLNTETFNVETKVDSSITERLRTLTREQCEVQQRPMLQALLVDRCHLKLHRETKELPVYALIVAKGGPKFQEAKPGDTYPNGFKDLNGKGHGDVMRFGRGYLAGQGIPIVRLARMLSGQHLDRYVLDKTGLAGKYDFTLRWTPDGTNGARPKGADGEEPLAGSLPSPETSLPSLFTAIQEQLGLKLQPEKDPVPILVIDHIERPSEN